MRVVLVLIWGMEQLVFVFSACSTFCVACRLCRNCKLETLLHLELLKPPAEEVSLFVQLLLCSVWNVVNARVMTYLLTRAHPPCIVLALWMLICYMLRICFILNHLVTIAAQLFISKLYIFSLFQSNTRIYGNNSLPVHHYLQ